MSHEPSVSCGWIANRVRPASVVVLLVPSANRATVIRHDEGDVPPDADLVQDGHDADAGDIEDEFDEHQHGHREQLARDEQGPAEREDLTGVRVGAAGQRRDDGLVEEERGREVDAGHDGELADQVEPRGPPAPVLVLHDAGPVVEPAGRRIGGRDLRHGGGDGQHEDRDERPSDQHGCRAGPGETVVVQDDRAGQDADDAEADREVAEPAHRAEQLLRIAELVQVGDVLLDDVVAGLPLGHRSLPHSDLIARAGDGSGSGLPQGRTGCGGRALRGAPRANAGMCGMTGRRGRRELGSSRWAAAGQSAAMSARSLGPSSPHLSVGASHTRPAASRPETLFAGLYALSGGLQALRLNRASWSR